MFRYFQAYIGGKAISKAAAVYISRHISKRHSYYFAPLTKAESKLEPEPLDHFIYKNGIK